MIDSFLLWLFVKISQRWFGSVIFASDPETERTTSIFFFDRSEHAERMMELISREKLNHELKKEQMHDY